MVAQLVSINHFKITACVISLKGEKGKTKNEDKLYRYLQRRNF